MSAPPEPCFSSATGVLLAAGLGARFDPEGQRNKLLARLSDGTCVAAEAARRLLSVVPRVVAVVRPGAEPLAQLLEEAGCRVVVSAHAHRGMGASLATGIAATQDAHGWIVALADMPRVAPTTIAAVARAIDEGATLAAPFYEGQRGHPAGFGREHRDALLALDGDAGARALLAGPGLTRIAVNDPGILRDIDTPADLERF